MPLPPYVAVRARFRGVATSRFVAERNRAYPDERLRTDISPLSAGAGGEGGAEDEPL